MRRLRSEVSALNERLQKSADENARLAKLNEALTSRHQKNLDDANEALQSEKKRSQRELSKHENKFRASERSHLEQIKALEQQIEAQRTETELKIATIESKLTQQMETHKREAALASAQSHAEMTKMKSDHKTMIAECNERLAKQSAELQRHLRTHRGEASPGLQFYPYCPFDG